METRSVTLVLRMPELQRQAGHRCADRQEYEAAISHFQKAIEAFQKDGDRIGVFVTLGFKVLCSYAWRKDTKSLDLIEKISERCQQLSRTHPDFAGLFYKAGEVLLHGGRYESSYRSLKEAEHQLAVHPNASLSLQCGLILSRLYQETGRFEEALDKVYQLVTLCLRESKQATLGPIYRLAHIYKDMGDYNRAHHALDELLKMKADLPITVLRQIVTLKVDLFFIEGMDYEVICLLKEETLHPKPCNADLHDSWMELTAYGLRQLYRALTQIGPMQIMRSSTDSVIQAMADVHRQRGEGDMANALRALLEKPEELDF